ncbi:Oidioi.mRNA.OKI2018_I69.XSR.g14300.t1.cds [Oikopleura dioica]|uniref:Oidioi.mRNA.OKI2018_I69.XSR.g14300.t1.cds n=1 Tax=Oikopleura dioica TaxID=34765 RepID=A0ABN7SDG4_OIKDI|nr:Oidioi.mRNA.OKI2018_I69.XSR.g14300.t1.cds [Oikopleura dioica]
MEKKQAGEKRKRVESKSEDLAILPGGSGAFTPPENKKQNFNIKIQMQSQTETTGTTYRAATNNNDNFMNQKKLTKKEEQKKTDDESFKQIEKSIYQDGLKSESTKNTYAIQQALGRGGFAKVYKAVETIADLGGNGPGITQTIALKVIPKTRISREDQYKKVMREIKLQSGCNHPNILSMFSNWESDTCVAMVLDYCEGGSLSSYSKQFDNRIVGFENAAWIIGQVLRGVQYLHERGIIHRDIKPANILLSMGRCLIADFGLALEKHEREFIICGTPNYISPEVYERKLHTEAADIWAVGLVYFSIMEGRSGFSYNPVETLQKRVKDVAHTPHRQETPQISRDFFKRIIVKDPKHRPSIDFLLRHRAVTNRPESTSDESTMSNNNEKTCRYISLLKAWNRVLSQEEAVWESDPETVQCSPERSKIIRLGYLMSNGDVGVWKAGGFQVLEHGPDKSLEIRYRGEKWETIPEWYFNDNPECLNESLAEIESMRNGMGKLQNAVTCLRGRVAMKPPTHLVYCKRLGLRAIVFFFSNGDYQVNFLEPASKRMKIIGSKNGICLIDRQRKKHYKSWDSLNEHERIVIDTEEAINDSDFKSLIENAHQELLLNKRKAERNGGGHDCISLNCRLLPKIVIL